MPSLRQRRRSRAGHRALANTATARSKRSGPLSVVKRSCREERIRTKNQIRHLAFCAPDEIREATKALSRTRLAAETARWRPRPGGDPVLFATRFAMTTLGRRATALEAEAKRIDELVVPLIRSAAPSLLEVFGVGPDTAAALLVAAGDNPERIRSEAAWAHLCGVAPIPASSGKTTRRRLNRGGNRQANHALHTIAVTRMHYDQRTRAYVQRHLDSGRPKPEIIRNLKRYIAREVYHHLAR
jgi:transposase